MFIRHVCVYFILLAILLGGCSPTSSVYKDVLISYSTISDELELESEEFNDLGGGVHCRGTSFSGEKQITTVMNPGRSYPALDFSMYVSSNESVDEAQRHIDFTRNEVGISDANHIVRLPHGPWKPTVTVDDYAQAEYRYIIDPSSGHPSVSYVIAARIGAVLFYVQGRDRDAPYRPRRGRWPYGNAMWTEAHRAMDLLISRHQQLQR